MHAASQSGTHHGSPNCAETKATTGPSNSLRLVLLDTPHTAGGGSSRPVTVAKTVRRPGQR
jgi:hypothetical protein